MSFNVLLLVTVGLEIYRYLPTDFNPMHVLKKISGGETKGLAWKRNKLYFCIFAITFGYALLAYIWQTLVTVPIFWPPIIRRFLWGLLIPRVIQLVIAWKDVFDALAYSYKQHIKEQREQAQRRATVRHNDEQEQASLSQHLDEIKAQLKTKKTALYESTNTLKERKQVLKTIFTDALYQKKANAHEVEHELNTLMNDYVYPNKSEACDDSALDFVKRVYNKVNTSTKAIKPVTEETLAGLLHLTSTIKGYTGEQKVARIIQRRMGQNDIFLDSLDLSMMYHGDQTGDNHTNQIDQLLVTPGGIFIFEIKNWYTRLAKYAHEGSEISVYLSSGGYLEFELELRNHDDTQVDYFPKKGTPVVEQTANHVRAVKQLLMQNNMWDFSEYIHPVIVLAEDNEHYYIKNGLHAGDPYLTTVNDVVDYIYQDRETVFSEANMYRIRKIILDDRFNHEEKRYQYTFFNYDSDSWQQFLDVVYDVKDYARELDEIQKTIDATNGEITHLNNNKEKIENRLQELKQKLQSS